jgi:hypothetical protein
MAIHYDMIKTIDLFATVADAAVAVAAGLNVTEVLSFFLYEARSHSILLALFLRHRWRRLLVSSAIQIKCQRCRLEALSIASSGMLKIEA